MFSDQYEIAVLTRLRGVPGGYAGAVKLAELSGLPQYTVRSALSSLRRRRMAAPGGRGHWGEYSITEHGLTELARIEQLRAV